MGTCRGTTCSGRCDLNYDGWLVIESFVLGNEAIAKAAAIWRDIEPSGDQLAQDGLAFLQKMRAG